MSVQAAAREARACGEAAPCESPRSCARGSEGWRSAVGSPRTGRIRASHLPRAPRDRRPRHDAPDGRKERHALPRILAKTRAEPCSRTNKTNQPTGTGGHGEQPRAQGQGSASHGKSPARRGGQGRGSRQGSAEGGGAGWERAWNTAPRGTRPPGTREPRGTRMMPAIAGFDPCILVIILKYLQMEFARHLLFVLRWPGGHVDSSALGGVGAEKWA